jgi:CHAT domain-containing protein
VTSGQGLPVRPAVLLAILALATSCAAGAEHRGGPGGAPPSAVAQELASLPAEPLTVVDGTAAAEAYARAAERHVLDYSALLRARGGAPAAFQADFEQRLAPLATADGLAAYLRGRLPAGTAVVFYDLSSEALDTYVVTASDPPRQVTVKLAQDEVERRVTELRRAIFADGVGAERGVELEEKRALRERAILEVAHSPPARAVPPPGAAAAPAASPVVPAAPPRDLRVALERLRRVLLPTPVAERLAGVRHLVVVPTRGLGIIPFAALPLEPVAALQRRGARGLLPPQLLDRMSVTLAANLFDLGAPVAPWTGRFTRALVVGNPDFANPRIPQLPGAEREARQVAARLAAPPLLGRDARAGRVLTRMRTADLIYLATHAVASPVRPLDGSYLLMAGPPSQWLNAWMLQRLKLEAQLVVLSACDTGLGQSLRAGIIGLARAFHKAGVRRIVMSLWKVDDEATQTLMTSFVGHLAKEPPAGALRQAMLELRRTGAPMLHWASFMVLGHPQ